MAWCFVRLEGCRPNNECYLEITRRSREATRIKCPVICGETIRGFCVGRVRTSLLVRDFFGQSPLQFTGLDDTVLFPKRKRPTNGRRLATIEETYKSAHELKAIPKSAYQKRWRECVISDKGGGFTLKGTE